MYVPITPGGTVLVDLEANTEQGAWDNLMEDAAHMPYKDQDEFIERGYAVEEF